MKLYKYNIFIELMIVMALMFILSDLTGCAQIEAKVAADTAPIVQKDLSDAIAIAQTHATDEATPIACYTGLQAWVNSLPTTAAPLSLPEVGGVISTLELGRVAMLDVNNPGPALPPLDHATQVACVYTFADTKVGVAKLSIVLAGLAKGAGIAKAGAALQGQAAALKAAEAAIAVGKP